MTGYSFEGSSEASSDATGNVHAIGGNNFSFKSSGANDFFNSNATQNPLQILAAMQNPDYEPPSVQMAKTGNLSLLNPVVIGALAVVALLVLSRGKK